MAAIVSGSLTLLLTLVLLFLYPRIQIAIELLEEASKAVAAMPSVLFFPVAPFLFQAGVILWFLLVGVFLASSGDKEYKVDYKHITLFLLALLKKTWDGCAKTQSFHVLHLMIQFSSILKDLQNLNLIEHST